MLTRMRAPTFAAGVFLTVAACRVPVDSPLPMGAVALSPPAQFRLWWDVTSQCARVAGRFADVRWYVVPGAASFPTEHGDADGAWYAVSNRIVLAGRAVNTGGVVRHEMLHALLRVSGAHPAVYFQRQCAGIVFCDGSCATVTDPLPADTTGVLLAPSDLAPDLQLLPANGRVRDYGGWYVGLASVTNRRSVPVRISLRVPGQIVGHSFGYTDNCWTATYLDARAWIALAPGETRQQAFDHEWCGPGAALLRARGSVGVDSTSVRQLLIEP